MCVIPMETNRVRLCCFRQRHECKVSVAHVELLRVSDPLPMSCADELVSFLSRQKGRLAACKHRQVCEIAEDAVSQTLAALQTGGCPEDALQ